MDMLETSSFRCMTTDIELFLATEDGRAASEPLYSVERFFQEVEARFSRFRPDSELVQLNQTQGEVARVSPELAELVELALAAARESDGIFDPTVIDALEAGEAAGGEFSPLMSAAVLVADRFSFPYVDLRVDNETDPIAALRRMWLLYEPQAVPYVDRATAPEHAMPANAVTHGKRTSG